jgi:hypothetical protein
MKMNARRKAMALLTTMGALFLIAGSARAQTTVFTYQGKLTENGNPASGTYAFIFKLFDAQMGGTQLAADFSVVTEVNNGLFTASLSFGNPFSGEDRFLDVSVRRASASTYTQLTPRQQITSAPYAVHSISASTADTATSAFGLGGITASGFIQNTGTTQAATNFNISGDGTAGGTLSGSIIDAATQLNIGGNRVLSTAGSQNLFAGFNSGSNNTTGSNNSFFGFSAGKSNTTGTGNSFFGSMAGQNNTTGSSNSFFGANAGFSNTIGSFDSFFGDNSGFVNNGDYNSFFGNSTGINNTTGGNNVFVGYSAGVGNRTGSQNTFIGGDAGENTTTQNYNTFIGQSAGQNTGTNDTNGAAFGNTFIGAFAGTANTTGGQNTFVGLNAGTLNTTGSFNAFINGGGNNTTGSANIFVGGGNSNTTGSANTFLGTSVAGTTTGSNNTFVGCCSASGTPVSNSTVIGSGTVSTDHTIVIGSPSEQMSIPSLSAANLVNLPGVDVQVSGTMSIGSGTVPALQILKNTMSTLAGAVADHLYFRNFDGTGANRLCFEQAPEVSGFALTFCTTGSAPSSLKTDLKPFTSGLEVVSRLNPISFKWKGSGKVDVGLNADEVANVESRLVSRGQNGEIVDVRNEALSIFFINAFKQQQEQIQNQLRRIEGLKKLLCSGYPDADLCK